MRTETMNFILVILVLIIVGLDVYYTIQPMRTNGYTINYSVTGVNIPGCGYFVDTRGRNFQQVNRTDYHEACHVLIDKDWKHFCEDN